MPTYTYTAIEQATGRERQGKLEGSSRTQVAARLKQQGLSPISLLETDAATTAQRSVARAVINRSRPRISQWLPRGKVRRRQLVPFTRQLATLVNAGVPLARGLEILQRQERHPAFQALLVDLARAIGSGGNFSDGLRRHPAVFDRLYLTMTRSGEAAGLLGPVLERQAQFMEKAERLRGRIKTALTYPVIIMLLATAILTVLLVFVVPKFESIFSGLLKGQPLPALTVALLMLSSVLRAHFLLTVVGGGLGVLLGRWLMRTERGSRTKERVLHWIPGVGDLRLKAAVARATRTLGALLEGGVPILEALAIARDAAGSGPVAGALDECCARVKQGETLSGALEETSVLPGLVTGMVQVGEETGALPEMLRRSADAYDEEVDQAVAGLTALLEPAMVVGMAVVVGGIVLALFLPIVSIIQHLQ